MTVRDGVNWFLDLQWWQALLVLAGFTYVGGFARVLGVKLAKRVTGGRKS